VNKQGLIFDIRRFSINDGPGIRTTVFFKGCPLNCIWCHNPESQSDFPETWEKCVNLDNQDFKMRIEIGGWSLVNEVMEEIAKDRVFYDESSGGVTFSGGEPLAQPEFLAELIEACISAGLHTAIDTSGFCSGETISRIAPLTDLFLFDLKLMDDQAHNEFTGVSVIQILENLKFLLDNKYKVIIRFPVIPGINDHTENVHSMIRWLSPFRQTIVKVDLLPFHKTGRGKYHRLGKEEKMMDIPDIRPGDLEKLRSDFRNAGFIVN